MYLTLKTPSTKQQAPKLPQAPNYVYQALKKPSIKHHVPQATKTLCTKLRKHQTPGTRHHVLGTENTKNHLLYQNTIHQNTKQQEPKLPQIPCTKH